MNKKHMVILISGKQGSGKTTLADNLSKRLRSATQQTVRTRFAKPLYAIHDAAREAARSYGIPYPDKFGEFLQVVGTELGRDKFGENVWVDALKTSIKKETEKSPFFAFKDDQGAHFIMPRHIFIIDDCRFVNELAAFDNSEYEVYKVRLEASADTRKGRAAGWRDNEQHRSETELDGLMSNFNLVIDTSYCSIEKTTALVLDLVGFASA